jgi:hypothetical protein
VADLRSELALLQVQYGTVDVPVGLGQRAEVLCEGEGLGELGVAEVLAVVVGVAGVPGVPGAAAGAATGATAVRAA